MMTVLFILAYLVLGFLSSRLIVKEFTDLIVASRHVEEERVKEVEKEVFNELDVVASEDIGRSRALAMGLLTILCWPISTPVSLYKVHQAKERIVDFMNHN